MNHKKYTKHYISMRDMPIPRAKSQHAELPTQVQCHSAVRPNRLKRMTPNQEQGVQLRLWSPFVRRKTFNSKAANHKSSSRFSSITIIDQSRALLLLRSIASLHSTLLSKSFMGFEMFQTKQMQVFKITPESVARVGGNIARAGRGTVGVFITIRCDHNLTKSSTTFGITTRVNPPKIFPFVFKTSVIIFEPLRSDSETFLPGNHPGFPCKEEHISVV
jgi:hypothetical protein